MASFTVEPAAGYVGTVFSPSTPQPAATPNAIYSLSVRFDWEYDGFFDTGWWNASQTIGNTYDTAGTKTVVMIVKDTEGLTNITTRTLQVSDPAATRHPRPAASSRPPPALSAPSSPSTPRL